MAQLTVGELRKRLKGIPDRIPVYIADHDHHEYGTNSSVGQVYVANQKDICKGDDFLERHPEFKIEGPYLVIRP